MEPAGSSYRYDQERPTDMKTTTIFDRALVVVIQELTIGDGDPINVQTRPRRRVTVATAGRVCAHSHRHSAIATVTGPGSGAGPVGRKSGVSTPTVRDRPRTFDLTRYQPARPIVGR